MVYVGGLVAMAALALAAQLAAPPTADLAYLLHAAARVLDGARLYVDVVEVNPPLIVLLNLPAVLLARASGLSEVLVYRVLVTGALLGALALADWALRHLPGSTDALRRRLVLVIAFCLFLAAGDDFGQREHLLAALALPYLLLAAGRATGSPAPRGGAVLAAALAGLGLALKPQFLLVWVAVEGYVAWRARAVRPARETITVLAIPALYLAGVALLYPEYFQLARLLGSAYMEYGRYPFAQVLVTAPGTALCALALLAYAALRRDAAHRALWSVLALALVAAFLAGAVQQKGWGYHFYPARVLALLLLGLALADVRRPLGRPVQRVYAAVALAALGTVALSALSGALARASHRDPGVLREQARLAELVAAVRRHVPPGGSVYALSYSNEAGFPLVNYSGARWASRFPHLWILEAVYHDQLRAPGPLRYRPRDGMGPAERYLNDAVYLDLAEHRPDLLMVLRHARDGPANVHRRLNYVGYFSRDPRIEAVLQRYRQAGTVGEYVLYVRADSSSRTGPRPSSAPGTQDLARAEVRGERALLSDPAFLLRLLAFGLLAGLGLVRAQREAAASAPHDPARR